MNFISIGRHPDNNIVINDFSVARHHLQIIQHDDGRLTLVDLRSTNGTYINGRRVDGTAELHYGDIVEVGNTTLNWEYYSLIEALKNLSGKLPIQPPLNNAMCYCPPLPKPPKTSKLSRWKIVLISIAIVILIELVITLIFMIVA